MKVKDFYGNMHFIYIYRNEEDFAANIADIKDEKLYFDIDLDYMTISNPPSLGGKQQTSKFTYMSKKQISKMFSYENPNMRFILDRIVGFTIAREPGFCGGLKKSNNLFHQIENCFFKGNLFNGDINKSRVEWRHLLVFLIFQFFF